jgi:copper transport protein
MLGALALWAGGAFAPNPVAAHANYLRSSPAAEAVLREGPALVQIWFSEPLSVGGSRLSVRNTNGGRVDNGDMRLDPADPRAMQISLPTLPPGVYTVLWENTSATDGHSLAGAFPFTIGDAPPAVGFAALVRAVDRAALANQSPSAIALTSRWLVLLALAGLGGATVFTPLFLSSPKLVAARLRAEAARRRGLALLIAVAAFAFGLEAALRLERSGLALLSSQYGLILAARAALLAGLIAVWRARRETGWAGALLCGLLLLTQSANSHSAAEAGGLPVLADWLHLAFTSIWLGGVGQLAFIDAPLAMRSSDPAARSDFGALIARFSPWAMFCVLGLALTGLAQSALFIGNIEALWTTAYGRALSLKLALFAVLLIFGAVHQLALAPRLREFRRRAATTADNAAATRAARAFRASVCAEAVIAAGALIAAGLLISLPPSRDIAPDPTVKGSIQTRVVGDVTLTLGASPAEAGLNQFVLRIDGPPGAPAQEAVLRIGHETINTGLTEIILPSYAQPVFAARSSALALQGQWRIEAIVRRAGLPDIRTEFWVLVEK